MSVDGITIIDSRRIRIGRDDVHIDAPYKRVGQFAVACFLVSGLVLTLAVDAAAQDFAPDSPGARTVAAERITLEELIAHAQQNAPAVLAVAGAQADVDAAAAAALPARLANPELTFGLGPILGTDGNGVAATAALMQPLEVHNERDLRAAVASRWTAEQTRLVDEANWAVHADVHAAYTDALAAERRWEIYSELVAFTYAVRDVVARRVDAGEDPELDLLLADADRAAAQQQEMDARTAYADALARLAASAAWTRDTPPAPGGDLEPPQPPPELQDLLDVAAEHRPDARVLAERITRLETERALAEQESRPDPAIGGEYEFGATANANDHRLLFVVQFGLGSENRRRAAAAPLEADIGHTLAEAAALDASIDAEIRAAWQHLQGSYERVQLYESNLVPRWQTNLELVQRAFEEGEIDLMGVLMAEERLIEQQVGAIEAARDYYAALAALELAVGAEVMR